MVVIDILTVQITIALPETIIKLFLMRAKFLYYLAVVLFVVYFILTSIRSLDVPENKLYFKIFLSLPFLSLLVYHLLNLKKNEK